MPTNPVYISADNWYDPSLAFNVTSCSKQQSKVRTDRANRTFENEPNQTEPKLFKRIELLCEPNLRTELIMRTKQHRADYREPYLPNSTTSTYHDTEVITRLHLLNRSSDETGPAEPLQHLQCYFKLERTIRTEFFKSNQSAPNQSNRTKIVLRFETLCEPNLSNWAYHANQTTPSWLQIPIQSNHTYPKR